MKKTKPLILITLIMCILFTLSLADVGDWNSYDSYDSYDYSSDDDDYSWDDDDDDYSYSRNDDDDYKSTPKITDESYEYDETWNEATVIPVEGYPDINYSNTTPNYYLYYMRNYKLPEGGGLVPKNAIEKTIRIKKTALSYDYDVIYDNRSDVNNPLNKEVKSEEFYLTPDYEKVLHEEIYPRDTEQEKTYMLNDYFYYKKTDEKGNEIIYKVYKDLMKIEAKKYEGMFINTRNYTYFLSTEDLGIKGEDKKYYINNLTGEIVEVGLWNFEVDAKEEWMMPFVFVGKLMLGLLCLCFGPVVVILIAIWCDKAKKKNKNYIVKRANVVEKKQDLSSIEQLEQSDPNFNKDEFMQWVDSVFMELQTAWTNKDVEKIKTLEDNALYSTHKAQLERYIKDKKTNHIERIAIRNKTINGYKEDDGFEFIDLTLTVEMVDYIKDDVTGKVIKGRTEDRLTMEYNIVFKRKKGVLTDTVGELETVNCPSCGAPIDISASAICEYCNSVVNTSNHSWVISQYRGRNVYR